MTQINAHKSFSIAILLVLYAVFMSGVIQAQDQSDEFIQLSGDGTLRRIHVPVLMYHYISEIPADADKYRINLTVPPDLFHAHMDFLASNGYSVVSLYEINDALLTGTPLPEKPVALTFDDGHLDHYVTVFPILQRHQFTGTFFIITDLADLNHSDYLSWAHITEMAQAGMHMESHTRNHGTLIDRDADYMIYQILGSFNRLEQQLQHTPQMFCYPGGKYDEATLSFLQTTHIQRAVTTQHGVYHTTDNTLEMPRVRMTNETGIAALAALLAP